MRRHQKGCNCKRSGCLKNYCECFEVRHCVWRVRRHYVDSTTQTYCTYILRRQYIDSLQALRRQIVDSVKLALSLRRLLLFITLVIDSGYRDSLSLSYICKHQGCFQPYLKGTLFLFGWAQRNKKRCDLQVGLGCCIYPKINI